MKFLPIAELFERIESASSRLDMTAILAELYRIVPAEEMEKAICLCQGQIAPGYEMLEIGMGEKFAIQAIAKISGFQKKEIEHLYKEKGDLGLVAEELAGKKKQSALFREELTIAKVFGNLKKIALASGTGSQELKIKYLAELLNSASPKEAKYLARIPLGNMRLGIGDPTLMDAFALEQMQEFKKKNPQKIRQLEKELKEKKPEKREEELNRRIRMRLREQIEEKYNIFPDMGKIARALKEKGMAGLKGITIQPGIPIRPTLAERLPSAEEILKKIGRCAVEGKYDGFRFSVHKWNSKVKIFSRHSEDMTNMFPEIVEAVKKQIKVKEAIFEGEALAYNELTGEFYPFQVTIQRKRKYEVEEKAKDFPLKLFAFDLMYADGKNYMELAFKERRKALQKIIAKGAVIELTKAIVTGAAKEMNRFFEEMVQSGLEGIIAKDLNAKYIAGARKFAWIKLKRSYKGELQDSIDATIIGYFKGKGQRTRFGLGALLTAVYDEESDSFKSIAKIGTGMSEQTLKELEEMLSKIKSKKKPLRIDSEIEPDFWVEPKYVIEVRADEITKSPMHTAGRKEGEGFALRFPRMIKMKMDRKAEESTSVKEIIEMYKAQKRIAEEEQQP